jgi:hypothetical protein
MVKPQQLNHKAQQHGFSIILNKMYQSIERSKPLYIDILFPNDAQLNSLYDISLIFIHTTVYFIRGKRLQQAKTNPSISGSHNQHYLGFSLIKTIEVVWII